MNQFQHGVGAGYFSWLKNNRHRLFLLNYFCNNHKPRTQEKMKTNTAPARIHTHEGGTAKHINPELQLRRSVMSCLLWESEFYESGEDITQRIAATIAKVDPEKVAAIAVQAREKMKLRHVPLFVVREMARLKTHRHLVADTLAKVIQRADELAEFVALYWAK